MGQNPRVKKRGVIVHTHAHARTHTRTHTQHTHSHAHTYKVAMYMHCSVQCDSSSTAVDNVVRTNADRKKRYTFINIDSSN